MNGRYVHILFIYVGKVIYKCHCDGKKQWLKKAGNCPEQQLFCK